MLVQYRERRLDYRHGIVDVSAEEYSADRTQRVFDHRGVDVDGYAGRGGDAAPIRQSRGLVGHHLDVTVNAPVRE